MPVPPTVAAVAGEVHVALLFCLCDAMRWPDAALPYRMLVGMPGRSRSPSRLKVRATVYGTIALGRLALALAPCAVLPSTLRFYGPVAVSHRAHK